VPPWLVIRGAGFIGSHIVATLVGMGENVKVSDDFPTGKKETSSEISGDLKPKSPVPFEQGLKQTVEFFSESNRWQTY